MNHLHNDLNLILKKFPCSHCRQEFVMFGELLAEIDLINDALNIINIFVKDPNPFLPGNDPEESPYQDNEHNKILKGEKPIGIQSVRGWCCWVLMHCSVPKGRKYIPNILDHVERLTKDKNWYIKYMVCFTLSQLAKLRLSVLPDKRDILFFSDNPSVALAMAKRVESLAFNLLDYLAKESDNVQNAMMENVINIFSDMSELNESDSWKLLSTLSNLTPDAISKAAFLFICYAEFRKTNFDKLRFSFPGFFNDLASSHYNERRFKKLILDVINKLDSEKRKPFAWQFYEIIKEIKSDSDENKRLFAISLKYLDCLSKDYNENLFHVIYIAILHSFKLDIESEKPLNLFKKCLAIEKEFYPEPLTEENKSEMYWWPAYENDDILEYIFKKFGEMEFLDCFTLLLTFSKELNINVCKSVRLLEKIDQQNKKAQRIVDQLFERDPGRYNNLRLSWNENNLN